MKLKPANFSKLLFLEGLAEDAIACSHPFVEFCTKLKFQDDLLGLKVKTVFVDLQTSSKVCRVDAVKLKQTIARFKLEFLEN